MSNFLFKSAISHLKAMLLPVKGLSPVIITQGI